MKKTFIKLSCTVAVLISFSGIAQSVGVNTDTPTESLDIKGTTRIQTLPSNGQTNAISTKADGTKSVNKDQTFTATKTVVVDDRGVVGVINELPLFTPPKVRTIQYATSNTPINNNTPQNSVVTLGKIAVRFDGTDPTGGASLLSFKLLSAEDLDNNSTSYDNVIVNMSKQGKGGGVWGGQFRKFPATVGQWIQFDADQNPNVYNMDFASIYISLVNSRELYRVSCVVNTNIGPEQSNSRFSSLRSPAMVTLFMEKLTEH
ncbi:hypothetical protein [Riemerella columbipharyngis]|uniref:Uncharacterized protein n=1 Tax=Riemerella columbipharyngis TaxID=1071918 RepID=A0A1G6Y2M8_9FLAO|nr:hypothetical protein [Riemerella columbipharyngis]SDD84648.1 hypothetical protein SAMN05421544_1019 [Riemerella columbipharyngis]